MCVCLCLCVHEHIHFVPFCSIFILKLKIVVNLLLSMPKRYLVRDFNGNRLQRVFIVCAKGTDAAAAAAASHPHLKMYRLHFSVQHCLLLRYTHAHSER